MSPATLLLVHDGGTVAGTLEQADGRTTLRYEDAWRAFGGAIALSLSLPLSKREHGHEQVDPFLWGLLPDNELVLERWGKQFQVSSRNAFRLLAHVGEDCPGAFQIVSPDRHEATRDSSRGVQWLTSSDVERRVAAIRVDPSQTRTARDKGQFSLAGAQPKIALHRDGSRWGVPYGRTPTTHILKPPGVGFEGFAENEHFCLRLAQRASHREARHRDPTRRATDARPLP
ncbi:MAG: HipA N-terminal domain-containing protein [Sandaracinaceae bacterium]|nr:HipA N-terminal domain-containing protein [Sandaracinaceae bacterium]